MHMIKVSGIIQDKTLIKNKDLLTILLAMPLNVKVYKDGRFENMYSYASFSLFGLDEKQYKNLRKGNFVEITGTIRGNCDQDGNRIGEIIIVPRNIMKGVR